MDIGMPAISVIVLNWNGKHFLDDCLSSLRRQTFRDFETIFVDNGSTDGSVEFVGDKYPEVRVVALEKNVGFSAGNLHGYQQCQGQLVALLNNDTEADPHWLDAMHCASVDFPNAGSFASKMLYFDDRGKIDNCGCWMTAAGASVDIGKDESDRAEFSSYRWIFGGCGGAVVYRRRMLEEVGFLDPDFFMTYEDLDLSFRAQLRGYGCVFVPRAIIFHHYRGAMRNLPARQVYFSQRNIEFTYVKNMPLSFIIRYAHYRLLYEIGSAVYFARRGAGMTFAKAKLEALWKIPNLLKKRRQIQRSRKISNAQLRSLMVDGWVKMKARKFLSAWGNSRIVGRSG